MGFQFQHQSFNEYSGLISFRMDSLTPNPTFHTQGPSISSEPPSVTSWLNYTKNLQEDLLRPPSPSAASSQHSRQCDPATTHQITSLFCPKPSHHLPPSHLTRGKGAVPGPRKLALQASSASPMGHLSNLSPPHTDLPPNRRLAALGPTRAAPLHGLAH